MVYMEAISIKKSGILGDKETFLSFNGILHVFKQNWGTL